MYSNLLLLLASCTPLLVALLQVAPACAFISSEATRKLGKPSLSLLNASPSSSPTVTSADSTPVTPWTVEQLEAFASKQGVDVSLTTLGPGYRSVARAKHDNSKILGYVEGFVRPAGNILHLDKMEVYQPMVKKSRAERPELFNFGGISFGVGLLMGYRCLLHAKEKGCTVSEFLAIDDEEFQHKRLVRYYRRVGFQVVRYVGEDISNIPDRLVWGGCGTLMREDVDVLVTKWSALLTKMDERSSKASTP